MFALGYGWVNETKFNTFVSGVGVYFTCAQFTGTNVEDVFDILDPTSRVILHQHHRHVPKQQSEVRSVGFVWFW